MTSFFTALHYTKQCTGIVQYQKVPVCIPIQYTIPCITKSFILYVLFFSCPILATDQTVPYYFTLLFFLSLSFLLSLPQSLSYFPLPLPIPTILEFLPISKDILLYLVTRPDMPLQCIFWKPVETSNDNHSLSKVSPIPNLCFRR